MSDNFNSLIFKITEKYIDPISGHNFDEKNPDITVTSKNGNVNISIIANKKKESEYNEIAEKIKNELLQLDNIFSVNVILTSEHEAKEEQNRFKINAKNIIAIASGKGGVGKSTFAVNFASALSKLNNRVGILDADIYGPSIPRMMGLSSKPKIVNNKMIPLINYGIKCMSIGFLVDSETPAIWRGPMVMKALEQMYNGVEWGNLDYLVIDLPPGTGDAQLTLAQSSKLTGSIIVSTPQDVALIDARKGINMFKKVGVEILGIVENMSYFICDSCKTKHEIFAHGGVKKEAEKFKINFLEELPIDIETRTNSDDGTPVFLASPQNEISKKYLSIAKKIHSHKS